MIPDRTMKTVLLELPNNPKFPSFGLTLKWMKEERTGGRKERKVESLRRVGERGTGKHKNT